MGGDHAPQAPIAGAIEAARTLGVEIILTGPQAQIEAELAKHNATDLPIRIVDAPELIEMNDHPVQAIRRKKNSSIAVGLRMVRDGEAHAFVSAGHSGATMAGAVFILGRISGIERPALITVFPALQGQIVVGDVGANTDSKPDYLVQWAHMASVYARLMLGMNNPRVALLANGEEDTKGDKLVQDAHTLLKQQKLNFVGNAEPKDALTGNVADVVIADGFVGNLFLKGAEATARFAIKLVQRELGGPSVALRVLGGFVPALLLAATSKQRGRVLLASVIGAPVALGAALAPAVLKLRKSLDYRAYGGVPLLGVNGVAIIAHGKSDAAAITSALRRAKESVDRGLIAAVAEIGNQER